MTARRPVNPTREPDASLLAAILDGAPERLVAIDDAGHVAFINASAEAMFGSARGEILRRPIADFIFDRGAEARREEGALRPPPTLLSRPGLWARRCDGSEFPIEVTLGTGGGLVIASMREATAPRADERAPRNAIDAASVFDQCPVGLVVLHGVEGDRVQLNRRAEALLERSIEHLGEHPGIALRPDGRMLAIDDMPGMRARRGEQVEGVEIRVRTPSGALVPVLSTAAPLVDSSGAVTGAVVALQDLTMTKELERLRAERTSTLVHDLRGPLNAIALSAQLLAQGIKSKAERHAVATRIQANAQQMNRVIGQLMELPRLDATRAKLSRELVDITAVARASVQATAANVSDRRIELRAPAGELRVKGDAAGLKRVLGILLTNAIRYGRERTPVVVEIVASGDAVTVAVTNEGEGIAAGELPRLFKRFERDGGAKQGPAKRIGVGLDIAREIVEAHRGSIDVESKPGATTTFRFKLPVA